MKPSYGRTQEQHDNVQKLIDGLKALPNDYDFFDMEQFAENDGEAIHATPEHPCQSCMCIIGHGPSFGIPLIYGDWGNWRNYSRRAFGFSHIGIYWRFCFNGNWPNDINQAIIRLEMAQRGEIPDEWNFGDIYDNIFMENL